MGDYTRIGIVKSTVRFNDKYTPSGTVNLAIQFGEDAMKKYLGITPASDSTSMAGDNRWVQAAATFFAAHYLSNTMISINAPNAAYQKQIRTTGGAESKGYGVMSATWWDAATGLCDMHGRNIIIVRVDE